MYEVAEQIIRSKQKNSAKAILTLQTKPRPEGGDVVHAIHNSCYYDSPFLIIQAAASISM
uniref:Uncharacterized protein n=1 Tax=Rhizophagus irregularis (strain DAOM 181602 / DAOM 197198 / MUCL 43194) TaxID=747089 RepID=U9TM92_RHIID